jgi:hypothetical protein
MLTLGHTNPTFGIVGEDVYSTAAIPNKGVASRILVDELAERLYDQAS